MKNWPIVLLVGVLLLLILVLLPKFKFLTFFSPQGAINPNSLSGDFDPRKKQPSSIMNK